MLDHGVEWGARWPRCVLVSNAKGRFVRRALPWRCGAIARIPLSAFETSDPDSGYLTPGDPIAVAVIRAAMGGSGLAPPDDATILLPRGSGAFVVGNLLHGELASYNPQFSSIIEFEFDDGGRAVSFVERDPNDEIHAIAIRPGGP
jgi:hypothetical protein